ncbi:PREDICTED: SUN domain-containing protein 2-like [Nicrophorus vespilloides]|uniref:SUN domain-containing protein 2-like n=1 Tax=Nicrophorus vespilloides TaxID=110193 RepID=A0ABM1NJ79_NICVS|nr:PREDICTED: SUN domain-containing protein 2-like [Nicrophorus vespilloides]
MDYVQKTKRLKLLRKPVVYDADSVSKVHTSPATMGNNRKGIGEIISKFADHIPRQWSPDDAKPPEIYVMLIFLMISLLGIYYFETSNNQMSKTTMVQTFKNVDRALFELQLEVSHLRKQLERTNDPDNIEKRITDALDLYDADKVGMIDFALKSAGASIVDTPDTKPHPTKLVFYAWGIFEFKLYSKPESLLTPGTQPGDCFSFSGSSGRVQIRLPRLVEIGAVTIDHVRANLVKDRTSAPKDFKIIGFSDSDKEPQLLGEFVYNIDGQPVQTFKVSSLGKKFRYVELNVASNYGNQEYTCVYRIRIHGQV